MLQGLPNWNKRMSPPRCLYEILDVPQTASDDQIKKAYRTKALAHHPDKNPDAQETAEETFKGIQHAYMILSDPHERAWYDAHRTQILRGVEVSSGEGGTGDAKAGAASATELDLFSYFSPTAFSGMTGEDGFFAVFMHLFDTLAREEHVMAGSRPANSGREMNANMPIFGNMDTEWPDIRGFYATWEAFSSTKTFAFVDKWNLADAPSRDIRRAMERENKKERAKVRKEFNATVRELVSYVKKRDPRVARRREQEERDRIEQEARIKFEDECRREQRKRELEQARVMRDEALEEDAEQLDEILASLELDEKIDRRQQRIHRRRQKNLSSPIGNDDKNSDVERNRAEGVGGDFSAQQIENVDAQDDVLDDSAISNDAKEADGIESIESGDSSNAEELYCTACRKTFRTAAQMLDHERSKKHKTNTAKLRRQVLAEEEVIAKQCGAAKISNSIDIGSDEHDEMDNELDDISLHMSSMTPRQRKKDRRLSKVKSHLVSDGDDANAADESLQRNNFINESEGEFKNSVAIAEQAVHIDGRLDGYERCENENKGDHVMSKKMKRRLKEKQKKEQGGDATSSGNPTQQSCNKCGASFPSRTKLMKHVKERGHAIHIASETSR